jgi:glycosyltransferase involved in cell wall biosynthesis
MTKRPHAVNPAISSVHCLLAYKNFAANKGISHIGLGVSALNISQVLRNAGLWVDVMGVVSAADLEAKMKQIDALAAARQEIPLSHVVVSAPWIPTADWQNLISRYPHIDFAVISHSNVAFLHADPQGTKLIRDAMGLQMAYHNFTIAANSTKFTEWAARAYGTTLTWLPNLYNLDHTAARSQRTRPAYPGGGVLRIGCFGALRILKNQMTAAAAALEISSRLGVDTEFWLNGGRQEGTGMAGILSAIQQMTGSVKGFTLKTSNWETWPQFHATIRNMNLLLQPSFTESFNMVSADGVAEGVPSVTSNAIDWVPSSWHANPDDALDIANKGIALLNDPIAASEGWNSLTQHNQVGTASWLRWFLPDLTALHVTP